MSDSVGKISLDLEIQSDISKQISNVSSAIANNLKKSLNSSMKSTLENVNSSTKKTLSSITNNISSSMKKSMSNIAKTMKSIFSSIKMPKIDIPKPTNISMPKSIDPGTNVSKRGPPNIDIEGLKDTRLGKVQELDIADRQIDNLRNKLKILNEQLNNTFDSKGRNKLEAQILSTESRMNSLINKSIRLGAEVTKLDSKIEELGNESVKTGSKIGLFNNLLSRGSNANKKFSNSIKSSSKSIGSYSTGIGNTIGQMFKWMIILPMIVKGLTAFATALGQGLMTNQQFANSFNQIKTNMMVAFTPILQAILPALNTLMAALAKATTYIASFISAIFGKTYQQSYQATQQLIDAKVAMGAYGDSAKKAAKDVKGLAAIDEINTLGATNANIAGGGTNNKIPQLVAPPVDTSAIDTQMKSLISKVKNLLEPVKSYIKEHADFFSFLFGGIAGHIFYLIKTNEKFRKSMQSSLGRIGKILINFRDNVLKPFITWFGSGFIDPIICGIEENILPIFSDLYIGVVDIFGSIIEFITSNIGNLIDIIIKPALEVIKNIILDAFEVIKTAWDEHGKNILDNVKSAIDNLTKVFDSIWKNIINPIFMPALEFIQWAWDNVLKDMISQALDFLGKLIEIALDIWNEVISPLIQWFSEKLKPVISGVINFLIPVVKSLFLSFKDVFDSIMRVLNGIIDFIAGVFTGNWKRAWQGVQDIFGGIMNGLQALVKAPLNGVIGLINAAISGLNKIKLPSIDIPFFGTVGGWGFNIGKIPYLAKGGIIDNPTLAMVGEAGKEAVVPLENNTQGLDLLAAKLMERLGGTNISDSDKDRAINIILKIGDLEFARVLIDSINKITKMNGGECLINI